MSLDGGKSINLYTTVDAAVTAASELVCMFDHVCMWTCVCYLCVCVHVYLHCVWSCVCVCVCVYQHTHCTDALTYQLPLCELPREQIITLM